MPSIDVVGLIRSLAVTGDAIAAAVAGVDEAAGKWRPPSGAWSIVEIVNHLADEEVEDFRTRLRLTLEDPARDWPGIDPEGAARERNYHERDLATSLARFRAARTDSLDWLRTLPGGEDPAWAHEKTHPKFPPIKAGDLLASWAAHDLLHLRQIAKRRYEFVREVAAPGFHVGYAGAW